MAVSKYETNVKDKLFLIECWARDGLTMEQIADNLGISKVTFYKYLNKYDELSEHLKKGKEVADYEVENALFKRALGYKYDEVTIEKGFETKRVTKEVAPDTTAQIFWLKNRKPKQWRDRKDIDANVQNETKILDVSKLSKEEIKEMLKDE